MKILFSLLFCGIIFAQSTRVIQSTNESVTVEFDFRGKYTLIDTLVDGIKYQKVKGNNLISEGDGIPSLPYQYIQLGIQKGMAISYEILDDQKSILKNKFLIPEKKQIIKENVSFKQSYYQSNEFVPINPVLILPTFQFRLATIQPIKIAPIQFNPNTREIILHNKMTVKFLLGRSTGQLNASRFADGMTDDYLKTNVINYDVSKNWVSSRTSLKKKSSNYWYNPKLTWVKLFLKNEGVYKVTYAELFDKYPTEIQNIDINKLRLFNDGNELPLEIFDDGDGIFNHNDYFRFIGGPPSPSPYCTLNIYSTTNVYWLSTNDATDGLRYASIDGYQDGWNNTFQQSLATLHYEKDSIYEHLGLAPDGKRDYWFWGRVSGINGQQTEVFAAPFPALPEYFSDSSFFNLRVNLHGITAPNPNPDHRAKIYLTSQVIDSIDWDGQTQVTFSKRLDNRVIGIFPENNLQVTTDGSLVRNLVYPDQSLSDDIRVNWFEFDYWRENRVNGTYYHFKSSPQMFGKTRFSIWNWYADDLEVLIPKRNEVLKNCNITQNIYKEVLFVDSASTHTDYYCTSLSNFLTIDSSEVDAPSDLRNPDQKVDYLIITHKDFLSVAEKLKNFRELNFPDTTIGVPNIQVVKIDDIYDEFSYGLLSPFAIRDYLKYAFENYAGKPVSYVVLIGDLNSDYRYIQPNGRKNFIPSMPYHSLTYGLAASDNMFTAILGDDVVPDISIGRLSCETLEEANILFDKIKNYPSDAGKIWKQNTLLVSSGQNYDDEIFFGFNEQSNNLEKNFIKPNGFSTKKIFRYPKGEDQIPFQGDGPDIRKAIDSGSVIMNYYGHGGGYQWDLVFLNDDIYMLNNGGRLPFISSVTCYTAHFDNQNVFGEQFVKVPGKGAIGFWGSSGLTIFDAGVWLNNRFFTEVFQNRNQIVGKAIQFAKNANYNSGTFADEIALATYLGDPALELALPKFQDYAVSEKNIAIDKKFPLIGKTVAVSAKFDNLGRGESNDSVLVQLLLDGPEGQILINEKHIPVFALADSVTFNWTPEVAGTNQLVIKINSDKHIFENDYSDNTCTKSFFVYKTNEPNIVSPPNGFVSNTSKIEFLIADIGEFIDKHLLYEVQIDTSLSFVTPLQSLKNLVPENGYLRVNSTNLDSGFYFWRTRSREGNDSSSWSTARTFSVTQSTTGEILFQKKQLKLFGLSNVFYNDSSGGLNLNTSFLPPKPNNATFVSKFLPSLPNTITNLTALATDGKFLYAGSLAYYNNGEPSKIYKIGLGGETVQGQNYGEVSSIPVLLKHSMIYFQNSLFIASGLSHSLIDLNLTTQDTLSIQLADGLLNDNSVEADGGIYLSTDGKYVYNLGIQDSLGNKKYKLRFFDPNKNWSKVKPDMELSGTSYTYFSSFFIVDNYLYTTEYADANYMRRYNLNDGNFEEEWMAFTPFKGYYCWVYDKPNNFVYTVNKPGQDPTVTRFKGKFKNSTGSFISAELGPAKKWKSLSYVLDKLVAASNSSVKLEKLNNETHKWELLLDNAPPFTRLDTLLIPRNSLLRLNVDLKDTSTVFSQVFNFTQLSCDYTLPTELTVSKNSLIITPDSLLQGFPITVRLSATNISSTPSDSFLVECYLDDSTLPFYSTKTALKVDSSVSFTTAFQSDKIGDIHSFKLKIIPNESEQFSFNNFLEKPFYVAYDTVRPAVKVLIDGKEIIDGDIVSRSPLFEVSLTDNSPLPIPKTNFSIAADDVPVDVETLPDSIVPYPNNETVLKWKSSPLKEGMHTLGVFAKDSSGNYFASSVKRTTFYVYETNDLKNVYNYPNPFRSQTHFTFELRGEQKPDEIVIKIFTIAGRLIKEIKPEPSEYSVGFNKIFWNGKDQDGDPIANGLYLYKMIAKFPDKTVTTTQKLVKME